ncbi:MAG: acyl-CoA thioesterase [Haloferacaceae archaeon]
MPTPTDTYIENRERIQPNQTNNHDTAHGGVVMRLMDEIGAMSAMRFAGETCVTARVEGLNFVRPIPRGDIARVESWAFDAGSTSVRVRLLVDREDPRTGECERTSASRFVFVAVDEAGDPQPVPEFAVETDRDRELREAGRSDGDRELRADRGEGSRG